MSWKTLYQAENALQAHCLKGLLLQHNIDSRLIGESLSGAVGELPVDMLQVEIQVEQHKFPQAQMVISEYENSQQRQDDWFCAKCGEKNAATFDLCWHCGHDPLQSD